MYRPRKRDRHTVREQYAKLASDYDSRWSSYIRATTDATLDRLPPVLGDLLDVGCGTGALLFRLVDEDAESRLVGVDASAEMLDVARERLPADVELRPCWAEQLPFGDASFDTVTSCSVFHFIRHPEAALTETLRVLRPGGTMVITDWCDDYLTCRLCDWYLRWFDRSHFRMYGAEQCRELLRGAGARDIAIERYKVSWLWGLMTAVAHKPPDKPIT